MRNSKPTIIDPQVAARRAYRRHLSDVINRRLVAIGGVSIIFAVLLIAFYLFYVVLPLFIPAQIHAHAKYNLPDSTNVTRHLVVDEQNEVAVQVLDDRVRFFRVSDGTEVGSQSWYTGGAPLTSFVGGEDGYFAGGFSNGTALIVKITFSTTYAPNTDILQRLITPSLTYPLGDTPLVIDPVGRPLQRIALGNEGDQITLIAATPNDQILGGSFARRENLLGDISVETDLFALGQVPNLAHLLFSPTNKSIYAIAADGLTSIYPVPPGNSAPVRTPIKLTRPGVSVSAAQFLLGGISLIVGGNDGSIHQWFPVRGPDNIDQLTEIRDFERLPSAIQILLPMQRMKGFVAFDSAGHIGIYHATAQRTLLQEKILPGAPEIAALSPRANYALWEDDNSRMHVYQIQNEYPEISWSLLWSKVWYENRPEPLYLWQSSAASSDFEPKMSLIPLVIGTLKAAFYAMLVAIPLGVFGAIYTAYFMAPGMRSIVKPTIEIMGAMPSVVLGFLAGLWLAPLAEKNLPGIIALFVFTPPLIILAAWTWSRLPSRIRNLFPEGWEAALLIPVVLIIWKVFFELSPILENWLFNGDTRYWLTSHGITFNQRNSLVVGLAMGFAVAPLIFSISEDAIFAVPRHLTLGSLALGATPWQTMMRVVLLTASPGIFSAVMIGLGRAVGETMIMLMATGNTPVLNFNIFEGFRALSANIAVEMPEAEVNSTHYRILFLTALVLFLFTFALNTIAEIIRQRLRRRYSSM